MSSGEMVVTQILEDFKDMDNSKSKAGQRRNERLPRNKVSSAEEDVLKKHEVDKLDLDMEATKDVYKLDLEASKDVDKLDLEVSIDKLDIDMEERKEIHEVKDEIEDENKEGLEDKNGMESVELDECEEELKSEMVENVEEADDDNQINDKDSQEEIFDCDLENVEEKLSDAVNDDMEELLDAAPLENEEAFGADISIKDEAFGADVSIKDEMEEKDSGQEKAKEKLEPVLRKSSRIRKPKSYNIFNTANTARSSSVKSILNVAKNNSSKTESKSFGILNVAKNNSSSKAESKSPKGRKRPVSEMDMSDSDKEQTEKEEEKQDIPEHDLGDKCKDPGADASRAIDSDLLEPFRHGWVREVCYRINNGGPRTCDIFYWPPEKSRRKRRSKKDQEIYFDDFPSAVLSSLNFTYVNRPLGLNNEAYEVIRDLKTSSTTTRESRRQEEKRKAPRYTEVAEHEGLLSSSEDEGGEDVSDEELRGEFDLELPVSLQMVLGVTQLREEHIKRRKYPDRAECITPPLARDMPWTFLDDDPLGVFTELGGASRPATPPPLRAVRLTANSTKDTIVHKFKDIRDNLADPVKCSLEKDKEALEQKENLASHDSAIKKYKNYVDTTTKRPIQQPFRGVQGLKKVQGVSGVPGRPGSGPGRPVVRPPCSPHCLGMAGKMPDLQCSSCQMWFHGRCQGIPQGVTKFRCRNCPVPRSAVGVSGRVSSPAKPMGQTGPAGFVKVRLPMPSTNGKRPIVELVMLTNGKYQPIKFTNNRQVTESIPKRLFEQATSSMKTLYQRSVQVPKIGTKQVFLAINPSPGGSRPFQGTGGAGVPAKPSTSLPRPPTDQVSILVKPASGGSAVLLNVPRTVALKVKIGTTLSFSASNNQKYTVLDNKMHAAVGRGAPQKPGGVGGAQQKPGGVGREQQKPGVAKGSVGVSRGGVGVSRPQQGSSGGAVRGGLPVLPRGVSIKPITPLQRAQQRPFIPQQKKPVPATSNRSVVPSSRVNNVNARLPVMDFTPCSPYCPGVTGIPELECSTCHSLFHPKCVGVPQARVQAIQHSFKCKMCSGQTSLSSPKPNVHVINLD